MEPEILSSLVRMIESGEEFLLVTHENADPDGIAAVLAFTHLLNCWGSQRGEYPEVFRFPVKSNQLAKHLLEITPISLPDPLKKDGIYPSTLVFLDLNTPDRIDTRFSRKHSDARWILIDHHEIVDEGQLGSFDLSIVDSSRTSTAEILAEILLDLGEEIPENLARWLIYGILTDTKHLALANSLTFQILGRLMLPNSSLSNFTADLAMEMDRSEKIAHLKASRRMRVFLFGSWIICVTTVSSFESSVSNAMLKLGADLAITLAEKKNNSIRIVTRAQNQFLAETGLNLVEVLGAVTEDLPGHSGGHKGAAAYDGKGNIPELVKKIINAISDYLKQDWKEAGT